MGSLLDLAGPKREGSKLPISGVLVAPKDVQMPVVRVDPEPVLCGPEPAVDDATHRKTALAEPEGGWFRFTLIAGATLHANRHGSRYS